MSLFFNMLMHYKLSSVQIKLVFCRICFSLNSPVYKTGIGVCYINFYYGR